MSTPSATRPSRFKPTGSDLVVDDTFDTDRLRSEVWAVPAEACRAGVS